MSKGRIFKVLFLPIFAGLLATVGAYLYLQKAQPAQARVETVPVVVAAKPVPAKTVLTSEMLTTRNFPKSLVGRNEITNVSEAVGKATTVPLAQDEVVLVTKLATKDAKVGLAYHIPSGMRAITVSAGELQAVAGFPEPGDLIDIVSLFKVNDVAQSRIILEGLPILAVAQSMETTPNGEARVVPTVTLAVTPQQALTITTAEQKSVLRYLLRPANKDEKNAGNLQVDEVSVFGAPVAGNR